MKISELKAKLDEMLEKHGDVPVVFSIREWDDEEEVGGVVFVEQGKYSFEIPRVELSI